MLKSNFDVLAQNVCFLVQRQKIPWYTRNEWQIEIALPELYNLSSMRVNNILSQDDSLLLFRSS